MLNMIGDCGTAVGNAAVKPQKVLQVKGENALKTDIKEVGPARMLSEMVAVIACAGGSSALAPDLPARLARLQRLENFKA